MRICSAGHGEAEGKSPDKYRAKLNEGTEGGVRSSISPSMDMAFGGGAARVTDVGVGVGSGGRRQPKAKVFVFDLGRVRCSASSSLLSMRCGR